MKNSFLSLAAVGLVVGACSTTDTSPAANDANVVNITVGGVSGNQFSPAEVNIKVGQTVRWTFGAGAHNVVSGPDCGQPDGKFTSGKVPSTGTLDHLFDTAGDFPYYCDAHCTSGMKGIVRVTQ